MPRAALTLSDRRAIRSAAGDPRVLGEWTPMHLKSQPRYSPNRGQFNIGVYGLRQPAPMGGDIVYGEG